MTAGAPTLGGLRRLKTVTFQNVVVTGTLDAPSINETVAVNTNITTVGNGTLTAAALIGGIITRSGPVAAFSDATDTAAAIVAAITNPFIGQTLYVTIKNGTAFNQTLTAGSGVTLPSNNVVGPFMIGNYIMTLTSLTAVTFLHLGTNPLGTTNVIANPIITSLATVGAGVVTASAINGGLISRSGSQSGTPFTDTTDTAAAIIAGNTGLVGKIGESFILFYTNSTNALATLTGGTGVTVSGITVVPVNMTAAYLLTYTAAATVTMVGIGLTNSMTTEMSLLGSTSGQLTLKPTAISGASVLTFPAVTGTLASTTGTNLFLPDVKRSSAQVDATSTTLANVTGLTGFALVAGATYTYSLDLNTTCGGTGGVKVAFNYTTATLTAFNGTSVATTATAVAVAQTTSTTNQVSLIASNTANINVKITGTIVVNAAGTVDVQFAENSANSTSSVLVGSTAQFTRIA